MRTKSLLFWRIIYNYFPGTTIATKISQQILSTPNLQSEKPHLDQIPTSPHCVPPPSHTTFHSPQVTTTTTTTHFWFPWIFTLLGSPSTQSTAPSTATSLAARTRPLLPSLLPSIHCSSTCLHLVSASLVQPRRVNPVLNSLPASCSRPGPTSWAVLRSSPVAAFVSSSVSSTTTTTGGRCSAMMCSCDVYTTHYLLAHTHTRKTRHARDVSCERGDGAATTTSPPRHGPGFICNLGGISCAAERRSRWKKEALVEYCGCCARERGYVGQLGVFEWAIYYELEVSLFIHCWFFYIYLMESEVRVMNE